MSIELAEQLKREWTDKYVTVREGVPELRRFVGFVGQVKTVNMNCRALVEFNSPEDISWYDIDPSFLTVSEAPTETKPAATAKKTAPPKTAAKTKATSGKASTGLSPLEQARQQAAGSGATGTKPKATTAKPAGSKGLSPLELARQQGAAGSKPTSSDDAAKETKTDTDSGSAPAPVKPVAKSAAAKSTSGLSPLELARQQGAFGSQPKTPVTAEKSPDVADSTSTIQPVMSSETTVETDTPLSLIHI